MRNIGMLLGFVIWSVSLGLAQEQDFTPTLEAGPGVIVSGKPYQGMDDDVFPVGFVFYESRFWSIRGTEVGYRLFNNGSFDLKAIARWRFDGYEEDDSSALDGMANRRMTIDGGISAVWYGDWGALSTSFVNDLLNEHDGQEFRIGYSKRFTWKPVSISPSFGLKWSSDNVLRYYYGVEGDEVRAARPLYRPDDAFVPYAGIDLIYDFEGPWSIFSGIRYEWLTSEISDSPIVEEHHNLSFFAGLLYKF
ncbi:MAG: MipA/OmpV family protein [Sedimentisphaerales bacterium]|nr:MipA/OmpV family protein [Sedimentisphaerales bacterium]